MRGLYQQVRKLWKKPKVEMKELVRERLIKWRREPRFVKLEKPLRIDRARSIGYKSKKGFVVIRGRIHRGGRKRPFYKWRGRKPSKAGIVHYTAKKSLQSILEERIQKKYPNLQVLNSYEVGEDGRYKWFEVILVDPTRPEIKKDKNIKWITEKQHRKRALRGLTPNAKRRRR